MPEWWLVFKESLSSWQGHCFKHNQSEQVSYNSIYGHRTDGLFCSQYGPQSIGPKILDRHHNLGSIIESAELPRNCESSYFTSQNMTSIQTGYDQVYKPFLACGLSHKDIIILQTVLQYVYLFLFHFSLCTLLGKLQWELYNMQRDAVMIRIMITNYIQQLNEK